MNRDKYVFVEASADQIAEWLVPESASHYEQLTKMEHLRQVIKNADAFLLNAS